MRGSRGIPLVIGPFFILAGLALLLFLTTTPMEMSRYNPEWNGTSGLFALAVELGAGEAREPSQLPSYQKRTLLIVAPEGPYSGAVISAYRELLGRGGTILIAGETEETNVLLSLLGSRMRLQEGILCSVDTASSSAGAPVARMVKEVDGIPGVESLVLNRPLAVEGGEPLMETSILSWRDLDGDGRAGAGETLTSYAVLSRERLLGGDLYLLGDASVFINGMLESRTGTGSREFVTGLLERGATLDQIVSATRRGEGAIPVLGEIKRRYMTRMAIVTGILVVFALFWWRMEGDERGGGNER